MKRVRIGLIGASGWMGKTHALMYGSESIVFGRAPACPALEMVADVSEDLARRTADDYGAARWTTDWRKLVRDPDIDLVDIVTPNSLHREMALAAIGAGKHVYCEKPLAMNAQETKEMADAARSAGVITYVGFNYPHNPIHAVAREIINAGEIGELRNIRISKNGDSMARPDAPFTWRCDRSIAGTGTIGDTCSHVFSFIDYFGFAISEVCGTLRTVISERPVAASATDRRAVETDDEALFLCRFANGATGTVDASRVATGKKTEFSYSITGSKGALSWTYDRLNELQVYAASDPVTRQGFRRIEAGPAHPSYGHFYPIANFGMGYNDHKMIEIRKLIEAVADGGPDVWPNFDVGHRVQCYIDAVVKSDAERRWVRVAEIDDALE